MRFHQHTFTSAAGDSQLATYAPNGADSSGNPAGLLLDGTTGFRASLYKSNDTAFNIGDWFEVFFWNQSTGKWHMNQQASLMTVQASGAKAISFDVRHTAGVGARALVLPAAELSVGPSVNIVIRLEADVAVNP